MITGSCITKLLQITFCEHKHERKRINLYVPLIP